LRGRKTLAERYARVREGAFIPITVESNEIRISPGEHSRLIKKILEVFRPIFAADADTLYVGDTGDKWGAFEEEKLSQLGVKVSRHGQMPDIILYDAKRNWLFLIESVTSNGPIDSRRYDELLGLFGRSKAKLIFVTAFPDRKTMRKYLDVLAWETEVWIADTPDHMIHFNGDSFLEAHR
ncbi:MAG: BsuBI/PstI family type II restriction endonuclease, partial [Dissulfurispiraceae bacterium]